MPGRLIVVTGTGTGIGKTHVSCALLRGAAKRGPVLGYKPIESGVDDPMRTDAAQLADAGSFHVKLSPTYRLRAPLSPHLAARMEGVTVDWAPIERFVSNVRASAHVLLELPGGLFTPLTETLRNVDILSRLAADLVLLVAPDRLGALHDVGAAIAGAAHVGAPIDVVGLVATEIADPSARTNAAELGRIGIRVHGTWPWATVDNLSRHATTLELVDQWVG